MCKKLINDAKNKNWKAVQERVPRMKSITRIGELLVRVICDPDVPDEIFETVFLKFIQKRPDLSEGVVKNQQLIDFINDNALTLGAEALVIRDSRGVVREPNGDDRVALFAFGSLFWKDYIHFHKHRKCFEDILGARSMHTLRLILDDFVMAIGPISVINAHTGIRKLWSDFLGEKSTYTDYDGKEEVTISHRRMCSDKKALLLKIAQDDNVNSEKILEENPDLLEVWEKTELVLMATKGESGMQSTGDNFPLLQAMIEAKVMKVVVWVALKLFPNLARRKDENGAFPLHKAAFFNDVDTEAKFEFDFSDEGFAPFKKSPVELLLPCYKEAARCVDNRGRYPLGMFLDSEYRSWTFRESTQDTIKLLMKAAPHVLATQDRESRLMPFMTVACIHDDHTVTAKDKAEEERMFQRKVNLSFELLRADPSVVTVGIRDAAFDVAYLKTKLLRAEARITELEEELGRVKKRAKTSL